MQSSSVSAWTITIAGDPTQGDFGMRCRATARRRGCAAGDVWLSGDYAAERGDVLRCVGRFVPSGDDEWGRVSKAQGVLGTIKVMKVEEVTQPRGVAGLVRTFRAACTNRLDPLRGESRAILAGFLVADRRAATQMGIDKLFASAGIAHLMAVSGSHLAVVSSFVVSLASRLRTRPWVRAALVVGATGGFVCLCGAPPSAVRAWLMLLASHAAVVAGRRREALSTLMLVALGMALVEPFVTGQLGFRLSVVCVACLTAFSPYVTYVLEVLVAHKVPRWVRGARLRRRLRHLGTVATETLAATIVAMVVSMPLVCPVYGKVSLVASLANLAATPIMTACMALGLVACVAMPLPCASWLLLAICDVLLVPLVFLLRMLAGLPGASLALDIDPVCLGMTLAVLGVMLVAWWPTVSRMRLLVAFGTCAAVALALVLRWTVFAPARICVLDVGQGDAILVQDGPSAILVDMGPDDGVTRALARMHVLRLDAVVITHLHEDHYGGLDDLEGLVPYGRLVVAEGVAPQAGEVLAAAGSSLDDVECTEVGYHDALKVGGFTLTVVWPHEPVTGLTNPDSLELYVRYDDGERSLTGLLTGDAEQNETSAVIQAKDVGGIDFLKVGHHGSAASLGMGEAQALSPLVAVASAGEDNEFGHPTTACIEVLEAVGARFICTKDAGDVQVFPGRDGIVVRCARP